jgi:uncharacterized protein DUF4012
VTTPGSPHRVRRVVLLGAAAILVLLAAAVADAYHQAFRVYRHVKAVLPELAEARASLERGQVPPGDPFSAASGAAERAREDVRGARFTFALVGALPYVGRPVDAARLTAQAAGEEARGAAILREVIESLLGPEALEGASGSPPPVFRNGEVNLDLLRSLPPKLAALTEHLRAAAGILRRIPSIPFAGQLESIKARAVVETDRAARLARRATSAVQLIPSFLGGDVPRTYFLALQQNAALRGTGGSLLAYGFLRADRGRLTLGRAGSIAEIDDPGGPRAGLPDAVAWYLDHAHVRPRLGSGLNYSPDFPVVARALANQVAADTGERVDGVIALDPFGISLALQGGPALHLDSYPVPVTAGNVVAIVENEQFAAIDQAKPSAFPEKLMRAAFGRLTDPADVLGLLRRLGQALVEKRLQLWSLDPGHQERIRGLGWDGGLRPVQGDHVFLVQENRLPNKLDYYGYQTLRYTAVAGSSDRVRCSLQVTLDNRLAKGQPPYVTGLNRKLAGVNRAMFNLYVPRAVEVIGVDPRTGFLQHEEGAFRVLTQTIDARPGRPTTLTYRYGVPAAIEEARGQRVYRLVLQHQPLVHPAIVVARLVLPEGATVISAPGWTVAGRTVTLRTTLSRDLVTEVRFTG